MPPPKPETSRPAAHAIAEKTDAPANRTRLRKTKPRLRSIPPRTARREAARETRVVVIRFMSPFVLGITTTLIKRTHRRFDARLFWRSRAPPRRPRSNMSVSPKTFQDSFAEPVAAGRPRVILSAVAGRTTMEPNFRLRSEHPATCRGTFRAIAEMNRHARSYTEGRG